MKAAALWVTVVREASEAFVNPLPHYLLLLVALVQPHLQRAGTLQVQTQTSMLAAAVAAAVAELPLLQLVVAAATVSLAAVVVAVALLWVPTAVVAAMAAQASSESTLFNLKTVWRYH
jgi:hypothetical protein